MDCSQILPGAVNPGPSSLATGYFVDTPFIVYASGTDVVMLNGRLRHLQTVLGSDCGYGDTRINCVHCAESVGKIAVAWGSDVVIFEPESLDESSSNSVGFPAEWHPSHTLTLTYPLLSLCWNKDGSHLLTGGQAIVLWSYEKLEGSQEPGSPGGQYTREKDSELSGFWFELWQCQMALPITHLKFSPDGAMFASVAENDCLVKIWYAAKDSFSGVGSGKQPHSFVYVAHPRTVTSFAWRNSSPFLPRGSVANVLLTYCKDNICRLWSHSLSVERKKRLRFFIAASIDPLADIPFRSTPAIEDLPFIVHWLNNKETTLTSKAEKTQRGAFRPASHHSSVASFASSINEEILQSWVCIDESAEDHGLDPQSADVPGSSVRKQSHQSHVYSFSNFLSLSAQTQQQRTAAATQGGGSVSLGGGAHVVDGKMLSLSMKFFAQLMDEWCNSPDLLFCIHPSTGSLMVWTVEGLDAPLNSTRLVHISFSSCLPHTFPPHLAQSLKHELLQFLIKEPDVVQTREIASATGSVTDISLPVPQIKLPSGGSMSNLSREDLPKTKPDSTLFLVSSHLNGSLNTWSVELTVQSSYYTSIAGLIHCGGTGGHHSEVKAVHRHPWLPVLMTISSDVGSDKKVNGVENELIIWNADLPGTLENKSKLNELSRMSSPNPLSFRHVAWLPPISVSGSTEGAFARCPSSGLFVTNVGGELRLYQTSLYCITRPQPTSYQQEVASLAAKTTGANVVSSSRAAPLEQSQQEVTITSHLGKEGISLLSVFEKDLSTFDEIVSLHAFRMCSLVTSFNIKRSLDSKFCRDIVIALVENQALGSSGHGSKSTRSFLHLWRVVVCRKTPVAESPQIWSAAAPGQHSQAAYSLNLQPEVYSATVEKVYMAALPLPSGTHVVHSSPDCDRASSLQLQLPTISAPFLFTTACSDGTIRCWQFKVKSPGGIPLSPPTSPDRPEEETMWGCTEEHKNELKFELYEVFGASSSQEADAITQAAKCLDCYSEKVLNDLPIESYIPSALTSSYPGRFAMAHQLSKPASTSLTSSRKSTSNPLGRYTAVTVWECESSGGLEWSCEATLMLSGLGMVTSKSKSSAVSTLLEWLPMENGAYLLATCFASIISIFGMALPQAKGEYTTVSSSRMSSFLPMQKSATVLSSKKSRASWVCLLQFPCAKPYPGLSISCLSYTGSNSLLLSIGSEMHLYSCWVKGSKLEAFTPSKEERKLVSKAPSRVFREPSPGEASSKLTDADIINMLDYAHARNTPLPQYHPKMLMELMNSGKLNAVKSILVNVVKYLLLYEEKKKKKSYFDEEHEYDDGAEEEEIERVRFLSVSSDGYLKRSKKAKPKLNVESIPPLSLSKLGIFNRRDSVVEQQRREEEEGDGTAQEEDDYDELFSSTLTPPQDDFKFGFEEAESKRLAFPDLNPETSDFTPQLAEKLSTVLQYAQLADLSDLEQVRLLAIAETVANTKTSFSDQTGFQASLSARVGYTASSTLEFASSSGAGYASSGLTHGVRGGEAMDDCGLRYLLALENYVTLSESLPKDVRPGSLSPCDLTWAFHSDAELELLAAIRCVRKDELSWPELRNAGVGWWLRSSDTLRRLIEKLAKTQFMQKQDPLDASLLYMAMKKKSLVKGLFKTVSDTRMTSFFGNDFTRERWRKAALKNAFALLGKQRFEHAAAFFLLADKLWDAVEVCISRLGDIQLAFVITRLYEGDGGPVYERLLKECILGVGTSGSTTPAHQFETNPDPFLRSIACWLLQDYSGALETLLVAPETVAQRKGSARGGQEADSDNGTGHIPDPATFNFYFFLRSHPLLIRRDYSLRGAKSLVRTRPHSSPKRPLSGVGEEPFTPAERSLLFNTAYHHLSHGCPLLALDVLSRLPKSCNLGAEVCSTCSKEGEALPSATGSGRRVKAAAPTDSITGMIQSGTLKDSFTFGGGTTPNKSAADDDIDWSQPVSTKIGGSDDFDWSQPVSSQLGDGIEPEDEFDWSKPVSSQISLAGNGEEEEDIDWSKPVPPAEERERQRKGSDESGGHSKSTFSTEGLFILSLAEQLQYNACLSILTEELNTIYIPACCEYLWKTRGTDGRPLFPLAKRADDRGLAVHYGENAFEKTVLSLRGLLVEWLRSETKIVKEICGFEMVEPEPSEAPESYTPAGYDLLTTLMNYVALHAATTPTLLTIKLELMHLVNTLLPWSTGLALAAVQDFESGGEGMPSGPTCAVDPAQLPILTSCSLPAKHLTNLAVHLRMMSASIVEILATHTCPPIASKPLPHVREVFDLCCAISHCVTICLSPMRLAEMAGCTIATTAANQTQAALQGEQQKTPQMFRRGVAPGGTPPTRPRSGGSFSILDFFKSIDTPNTKPSKWPGVPQWPSNLSSDEGKDPTPLSLILVECCVAVYLGLLSVAWSWHSIADLRLLVKNAPSDEMWNSAFGGGVEMKKADERGKRSGSQSRSIFMQTMDAMTKRFRTLRQSSVDVQEVDDTGVGLFIAPKKTLLDHYLAAPPESQAEEEDSISTADGNNSDVEEEPDQYHMEQGPFFRLGSISTEDRERDHDNPDSFSWCLMNLCISKLVQDAVRKVLSTAGLEVVELVTLSPLLYSTLKILDEWESIFTRRLDALGGAPDDLFHNEEDESSIMFRAGPALMRHKFILEPDNSPFRLNSRAAKQAKQLWEYLVHQDTVMETFIRYIFTNKRVGSVEDTGPERRILYKDADVVSTFCINSSNPSMLAVAIAREVLEIDAPDNSAFDSLPMGDEPTDSFVPSRRSHSAASGMKEDFVMIQSSPFIHRVPSLTSQHFHHPLSMHAQMGGTSSMLLRRNAPGVKSMATHPSLAYYLTGSFDGSVMMWEFGTPRHVSVQRAPGTGSSVTKIRFTPQGNKYGMTDNSGKLYLWQGIHTSTKIPYKTLDSGMRCLNDFLFLGSSSFIATCGDASDNTNLLLWDTLLPPKRSIVREYMCHEGGATTLGYSRSKQRLYCGGKRGEICIFDVRQYALLQCFPLHAAAVNCIAVNDVDGYLVTGSADGDIKVLDLTSMNEIASFAGEHAKSRLFRSEAGVTNVCISPGGKLYSCGADGTIKCRTMPGF